MDQLDEGLHQDMDEEERYAWEPNATLYEYLIRELCSTGQVEQASLTLHAMTVRT